MFTLDGRRMYFTRVIKEADWYSNLYYIEKTASGWSTPKDFELNSKICEWHISFTRNNTAYFGSEREGGRLKADIFYTKQESGKYKEAIKLPLTINTEYNDCDPLIAPDKSYLIFHPDRPGGYGDYDLSTTKNLVRPEKALYKWYESTPTADYETVLARDSKNVMFLINK